MDIVDYSILLPKDRVATDVGCHAIHESWSWHESYLSMLVGSGILDNICLVHASQIAGVKILDRAYRTFLAC